MTTIQYALDTLESHKYLAEKVFDNLKSKSSNTTETIYSMCGKRILAEINEEIQKVHDVELRITVVASMKSGKSTFINALIGENILPIRANAMTMIPTEVIFKRQVEHPKLFLSKEIIDAMAVITRDVQYCLRIAEAKEEQPNKLFENEPDMKRVVDEMLNENYSVMREKEIVGPTQIQNSLLTMNDLIRLYLKLAASNILQINETNFEAFRKEIPRIEVPFPNAIIDIDNRRGNLVIVDTPGPNEAGMCKQLQEIVTEELRKADIIFVVFNYTTLKTEADAIIMAEVDELRKIRGDSNCLYAIVNKVDQRRLGDMSKDDVQRFISTNYGIEEISSMNMNDRRIFEIKAYFGLIAKLFLVEHECLKQKFPDLKLQDMRTFDDLGSALYDCNWESMKERITIEKLYKGALDMWRKSGLDELLQTAVTSLMNSISSRLVQSSLSKCQRIDRELIECLKRRLLVLNGHTEKLNVELQELQKEMNLITTIEPRQFLVVEAYLESLQEEFELTDKSLSDDVKKLMSQWLTRQNLPENPQPAQTLASGIVLGAVTTGVYMASGLAAAVVAFPVLTVAGAAAYHHYCDLKSNYILISGKKENIEKFNDDMVDLIGEVFDQIRISIQKRIDTSCKQLSDNFCNSIIIKALEILKRAEQVLSIPFKMKQQEFPLIDNWFNKKSIRNIDIQKYRKRYSLPNYEYFIPHDDLFTICHELVKDQWRQMKTDITKWYTTQLEIEFSKYLEQLKEYLDKYMNIMQSSLDDMNLNNTDQEQLRQALEHLINELCEDLQNLTETKQ